LGNNPFNEEKQNMIDLNQYGCYWVVPQLFMAGRYPLRDHPVELHPSVDALMEEGIRCFINLTHPDDDPLPEYASAFIPLLQQEQVAIHYHRYGILDFDLPSRDLMIEILDTIDRQIVGKNPVYLHCLAGRGRTGTVVGCWLIRHGLEPVNALQKIADLRVDLPVWMKPSPESQRQREFIHHWKIGL
jgi:hypothetical protein